MAGRWGLSVEQVQESAFEVRMTGVRLKEITGCAISVFGLNIKWNACVIIWKVTWRALCVKGFIGRFRPPPALAAA
jgi:hypothetical protein